MEIGLARIAPAADLAAMPDLPFVSDVLAALRTERPAARPAPRGNRRTPSDDGSPTRALASGPSTIRRFTSDELFREPDERSALIAMLSLSLMEDGKTFERGAKLAGAQIIFRVILFISTSYEGLEKQQPTRLECPAVRPECIPLQEVEVDDHVKGCGREHGVSEIRHRCIQVATERREARPSRAQRETRNIQSQHSQTALRQK